VAAPLRGSNPLAPTTFLDEELRILDLGPPAGGLCQLLQLGLPRVDLLDSLRGLRDVELAVADLEPGDLGRDLAHSGGADTNAAISA
jgi:hypothetical protein